LDRLQGAFDVLKSEHNPTSITVIRSKEELKVEVKKIGTYSLRGDDTNNVLVLVSPISGQYQYSFEASSGFWKSTT